VINRYVGNLPSMRGVFPDYPALVIRNTAGGREMAMMRWGMPPPARTGGPPVTYVFAALARVAEAREPFPRPREQLCRVRAGAQPCDKEEGRYLVRSQ
jgi:putative SOS response-associated peptidase YedK